MYEFWYAMEPGRRVALVVGVGLILALAALFSVWMLRPTYGVLFSELSETDAAAIVEQLQALKVDYVIADQGRTLKVPEAEIYETRLQLTSSGVLLKSGVGFELFDNAEYGMTDFAQKINYQRALQGELARTIAALSKIKMARVHLVLPESSLFRQKDLAASAAITVVLNGRSSLDEAEVKGIQQLVAASVQDLELANIIIVDQDGNTLSKARSRDSELVETRLDEKLRLESYLRGKVLSLVDHVFGSGRGIVNVNATINYDQIQRRIERQVPALDENGNPLVARSSTTKSVKPADVGGSRPDANSAAAPVNATNEVTEREYRFGRAVEEQVLETGNLSRLTISVLVPGEASQEEMEQLKKLVIASVGLDPARGDMIEVSALPGMEPLNFSAKTKTLAAAVEAPGRESSVPRVGPEAVGSLSSDVPSNYVEFASFRIPVQYLLYVAGAFILLLVSLLAFAVRGRNNLSSAQREDVLRELREWLKSDEEEARVG